MKITIISTYDTFGGASISGLRLHQAFLKNGVESSMLVQEKKSNLSTIKTVSDGWFNKKMSFLRFVLDRLQFLFYEKSKEVRFVFSTALIGTDISQHKSIKEAEILHLFWINFGFLSLNSIEKLGENNKPIIWNLQDMWAFTGGCHYSGDCLFYEKKCGNCGQFLRNPNENDLSRQTWERKAEHFKDLNLTIVSSSDWLAQKARESSLFKDLKVITIPTPIDVEVFQPTPKNIAANAFQLSPHKKYILFAAVKISDKRKGFLYFREAMSIIKEYDFDTSNVEILIFGQAQAADFEGLPFKVNMLGRLSDLPTIAKAYSAASVFVIPSLEDNLPNTVIESMACGTPVVGFNTGGIPEMIDHKITGYVADYKSSEDLARGIFWTLFESDYQALVNNSRAKVLNSYSEKVITEKYKKVYKNVAPSAPRGGTFSAQLSEEKEDSNVPPSGLISIITITYNAEKYLERTIQSIMNQTVQDFEYIIIDGNSKDGTLQIAEKYKNRVNKLISEPDKGLYDAMNKGLKNASGEFVWFMNAGDEINDNQAVEKIYKAISDKTDVLYGDTFFVDDDGNIQGLRSEITPHRLPKDLKWQDMKLGMLVCHQAFIVRKSIAPLYMENNLSADVDWEIECLKRAKEVKYLDFTVAKYLIGGISNKQLKRSLLDRYEVLKKHFGLMGAFYAHVQILFRGVGLILKNKGKYW